MLLHQCLPFPEDFLLDKENEKSRNPAFHISLDIALYSLLFFLILHLEISYNKGPILEIKENDLQVQADG